MNNCKTCKARCEKEYCFKHKLRKPLKQAKMKFNSSKKRGNAENIQQMQQFFMKIWMRKPHRSELGGEILISPPSSAYFHHILYKEKYPEAALDPDNIILLSIDQHSQSHSDMYRYEEINKRRIKLLEKYEQSNRLFNNFTAHL